MAQTKKKSKAKGKGKPPVKKAGKAAKKSSASAAADGDATPAIVEAGALAAPGDVLGQTATHKCGPGTFARDGVIVASLAGTVRIRDDVIETIREGRRPDIAVGVEVIGVVTRTNRTNARRPRRGRRRGLIPGATQEGRPRAAGRTRRT